MADLRALSLWQPWATMCVLDEKHETRSWATHYRGDLLICATASTPPKGWPSFPSFHPRGAAIGVVELVDCVPAERWRGRADHCEVAAQRAMGDVDTPGRYVWVLGNRRPLAHPIPAKGRQGLWTPSPELIAAVRAEGA